MCDDCTEQAYATGEETAYFLTDGLEEIADLHSAVWTQSRLAEGQSLCDECRQWWPCTTFLTAVGAMNYVR